jgi:multiple sugar transport system ATP-binding protein
MAMTQFMIKLDRVSKQLGRQQVLDDLSLEVKVGEFLVIFGPSGVGKTTLLRLIAGVMQPDGGDIYLNQRLVTDVEPEFRDVAMAFQTFALYPHMSAFDNIASPLRAHGMEETEIERRVNDIAELLKIRHVLAHAPGALSNGQKQRTALARSLVREPSIVLLDDPLRNVDAKLRYEMRLELPQILHRYKATMIYVTQDFKEAMALGDRVAVLLDGKVRQIGTPEDIYRRPHDAQVAQLFGDPPINTISVQPTNGEDLEPTTVRLGGRDWPAPTCPKELVGHDCLMGLRPEDIIVFDGPTDDSVPMRLEAVLPLNVRTALALRSEEGAKLIATIWDVRADLDEAERRKQTFYAHLDLSHAVFFDHEHGRRL